MYDTEMKLNHQIIQFLEFQLQALLPSKEDRNRLNSSANSEQYIPAAMLSVLVQYLSGLKAISCLLNKGFVSQTRGIFQTLGDDYEDIIFLSLPSQDGLLTPLHQEYLRSAAGDDCRGCYSPVSRCELRNMIRQAKNINHNVFQLYPKKQALQVLRPQGAKPCSVDVAIELHRHFAYKAVLLTVLTAKVAGDMDVMRACLNYRAHLEMIDPNTADLINTPVYSQHAGDRSVPHYVAMR
ncbi:hypothetical protein [uncultured Photobacterium sp.]|uniref:hypothetical protein n=1 Tax=uncultured Photobacterium sp. TaxID=173973 RepID=UPI00260DB73A|nr:hypothetical protein [uncultured Photobacterium sp.]